MSKFVRTEKYMQKLFEQALFDDKKIFKDAEILITCENGYYDGKLKAYCTETNTYLQFPRSLRHYNSEQYVADVVEVVRDDNVKKYYRAVKGSIRDANNEVVG